MPKFADRLTKKDERLFNEVIARLRAHGVRP